MREQNKYCNLLRARRMVKRLKNRIADFIDNVLLFIVVSILGIICAGYFSKNISVILISGFTCALAITFFIGLFKRRKELPKNKQKLVDNALTQFIFSTQDWNIKYIFDALNKKYNATIINNVIYINNTAVVVHLVAAPLTVKTLAEHYSSQVSKVKKLVFFTAYGADAQASAFAEKLPNLKVDIWQFSKVYDFLESLCCIPKNEIVMIKRKSNLKLIATEAFSASKTKKYLFASLLLLVSSMFMPYSIYYIVVASVLLTAAILCRINIVKVLLKENSHGVKKQK